MDFRSLQPSRNRHAEVGKEVQSLPCNLNDVETTQKRESQVLAEMVRRIPQIQGLGTNGKAPDRHANEGNPRGKENVTNEQQQKGNKSIDTASDLPRKKVDPVTLAEQNRLTQARQNRARVYSGLPGNPQRTPWVK